MTTRVAHLGDVCEYGGCARLDTKLVDGYLLCPSHEREHHALQRGEARPVMPDGWHAREECDQQLIREREYLMRLLSQQRRELDQLLSYLAQPRPASKTEHTYALGELLIREGAAAAGLLLEDITGPGRSRALTGVRQWLMYRCHVETDMSLVQIGRLFGGRDHTTVLHAIKSVRGRLASGLNQPCQGAA